MWFTKYNLKMLKINWYLQNFGQINTCGGDRCGAGAYDWTLRGRLKVRFNHVRVRDLWTHHL